MNALESSRKITSFYTHQAAAIDAVREGKHVIVSTSTASGKSVIYQVCILFQAILAIKVELQVPMLRFLEEDEDAKAIYIYPTKARVSEYFCCHYPDVSDYRLWPRINGGHSSNYFGLVKVFVT